MVEASVVAIVNSFNRLTLMQEGLPALLSALQAAPEDGAVVVFDAGSTDGSREWLRQLALTWSGDVPVQVIEASVDQDTSFSAGVNAACGLARAIYPGVRWFLLYETDNYIAGPEPLDLAIKLLESEERLAAAGYTVRKHSGAAAGVGARFPSILQLVLGPKVSFMLGLDKPNFHGGGKLDNHLWWLCDVVYTSPLMVRASAWAESGGLDAAAFPFSECDIDWAWRVHKNGWRLAVIDIDGVVHDNRAELSTWSATRAVHLHRARLKLLQRHRGKVVDLFKPLLLLRHLLEVAFLVAAVPFGLKPMAALTQRMQLLRTCLSDYEVPGGPS